VAGSKIFGDEIRPDVRKDDDLRKMGSVGQWLDNWARWHSGDPGASNPGEFIPDINDVDLGPVRKFLDNWERWHRGDKTAEDPSASIFPDLNKIEKIDENKLPGPIQDILRTWSGRPTRDEEAIKDLDRLKLKNREYQP